MLAHCKHEMSVFSNSTAIPKDIMIARESTRSRYADNSRRCGHLYGHFSAIT